MAFVAGCLLGYGVVKTTFHQPQPQAEPLPSSRISPSARAARATESVPSHVAARSLDLAAQCKVWQVKGWEKNLQQVGDLFVEWHQVDSIHADLALAEWDDIALQSYILARWADLELAGGLAPALAWSQSLATPDLRRKAMALVREQFAAANPAAEWERINQLPECVDKQNQLAEWAKAVAQTNPELAWKFATGFSGAAATRTTMQRVVLSSWARIHPEIAVQHISELPAAIQPDVTAELSSIWAGRNALQAARWALGLTGDSEKNIALNSSLPKLMEQDPAAAAAIWQADPNVQHRDQSLTDLAVIWGQADPQAAANWLLSQPESDATTSAMQHLVEFTARSDLGSGRSLLEKLPAGEVRDKCISLYLDVWAEQSPAAALDWAASQVADANSMARLSQEFQRVAASTPAAAFNELANLPSGPNRDAAIAAVVNVTGQQNPDLTIAWINQIANPELRQATLNKLAGSAANETGQ